MINLHISFLTCFWFPWPHFSNITLNLCSMVWPFAEFFRHVTSVDSKGFLHVCDPNNWTIIKQLLAIKIQKWIQKVNLNKNTLHCLEQKSVKLKREVPTGNTAFTKTVVNNYSFLLTLLMDQAILLCKPGTTFEVPKNRCCITKLIIYPVTAFIISNVLVYSTQYHLIHKNKALCNFWRYIC